MAEWQTRRIQKPRVPHTSEQIAGDSCLPPEHQDARSGTAAHPDRVGVGAETTPRVTLAVNLAAAFADAIRVGDRDLARLTLRSMFELVGEDAPSDGKVVPIARRG